jgi:SAM-dependent methyltransferase
LQDKDHEAAYFDEHYERYLTADLAINEAVFARYQQPRRWWNQREYAAMRLGPLAGKRLLDYGCGMGEETIFLAKLGAVVTAIDLSPKGIDVLRRRAEVNHVQVDARVADALATGLPSDSFDLIHGLGVLHHLPLAESLREVHRLLRPGGRGVFIEHVGNSALIHRLRERLLALPKTDNEMPLRRRDCVPLLRQFSRWEWRTFRLTTRLRKHIPLFKHPWFEVCDGVLLRVPPLGYFAGVAVITVEK